MTSLQEEYVQEIIELTNDRFKNTISLLKHNDNPSDITLHFSVSTFPIKVVTDFNKYCFAETVIETINLAAFNLSLVFKKKTPESILVELSNITNLNQDLNKNAIISDPFHIFNKMEEYTKYPIDYSKLKTIFAKHITTIKTTNSNKIPKGLLLSQLQITQLITNEIKKVNRNRTYEHYIFPNVSDPYTMVIRLKFNPSSKLGQVFNLINIKYGYDYMEFNYSIDNMMYPFIPPKLSLIKPQVKSPLMISLICLDILKLENWNPTIDMEYFITNLANQLEANCSDMIVTEKISADSEYLEYCLIQLASITKEVDTSNILIKINAPKLGTTNDITEKKYWNAGTGYGTDGVKDWDIKSYLLEMELQTTELTTCLEKINKLITNDTMDMVRESILIPYIIKQLKGVTMLELDKNKLLYMAIINIMTTLLTMPTNMVIINIICNAVRSIYEEIDLIIKSSQDIINDEYILQVFCVFDIYMSKYIEPIKEIVIPLDSKEKYCHIMKPLQFGTNMLSDNHRFIKNKGIKPAQKSVLRIMSEIASFKNNLPLNWESSIWVRVPKDNFNLFTFLISGPKDTPYENGLFEFHASLPYDYPNTVPEVLIHTTGNNTVRFNPNLYNSGKVCLSLLGTWQGQEGEKWNPSNSTFLQVMVSIQSLILVEQPYFNEPGWEREMNTPKGKKLSDDYNEEKEPHSIKLGMIDMIQNPPNGYEAVVLNHFRMKKEEIINKTLIWEQQSTKHKQLISTYRVELLKLLEKI